jgi:hypothetical protein
MQTALHSLIHKKRRALKDVLFAVGAVLYIWSPFGSLYSTAEEHGVDLNVVTWIHVMLSSRQILTAQIMCLLICGFHMQGSPPCCSGGTGQIIPASGRLS